jgi:hypothetical protein
MTAERIDPGPLRPAETIEARWPLREIAVAALLIAAHLILRVALIRNSPVELYQSEEYLALRPYVRLAEGGSWREAMATLPGSVVGLDGIGSKAQALLVLPVAALLGPTQATIKAVALLWSLLAAVVSAALGRRLFGPWGGVATLAGLLALPPAYLVYSTCTWGRHTEGGVLSLLLLLMLHRVGAGPPRRGNAAALGALLVFAPWFALLAAIPAALVFIALFWILTERRRLLGWTLAAAGLASLAPLVVEWRAGDAISASWTRSAARARSAPPTGGSDWVSTPCRPTMCTGPAALSCPRRSAAWPRGRRSCLAGPGHSRSRSDGPRSARLFRPSARSAPSWSRGPSCTQWDCTPWARDGRTG